MTAIIPQSCPLASVHIRVCALPSCTQAKTKILSVNNVSVPLCPCESLKYKLQTQDTIYLDLTAL